MKPLTDAQFDRVSWHDCHIWSIEVRAGDPDQDDWTSELAFDIDFIAEWICGVDATAQFRVAPATLTFHGVTDPRIGVDWGASGFQAAVHPMSIDAIDRERIADQKVFLDRPYYRWTIRLNWPDAGEISFGAFGFTQNLRAQPILTGQQCLSFRERHQMERDAAR
jgi:hypothetical protein